MKDTLVERTTHRITPIMQHMLLVLLAVSLWLQPAVATPTDVEHGIALFHAHQYEASKAFLEKALDTAVKDTTVHYYLCRIYFAVDRYERAIDHCKMAVQLRGNQAEYYFWLGRSYGAEAATADVFQQALLAPKIRKAFERTVALDPTHLHGRVGLINFYLRAPAMMGGSLEKAYAHIGLLMGLDDREGRLLLARYYEKTDQYEAAEATYQALQDQYGATEEPYDLYKQYGYFLLRQKRYTHAINVFTAQVRRFPARATAYEHLGDGYSADRRWQEAVAAYRHALQLDLTAPPVREKLHTAEKELLKLLGSR